VLPLVYGMVGALVAVVHGLALVTAGDGDPERRRRLREKLGLWDVRPSGPWIWIHGASVGETAMAVALADALAARVAGTPLVVCSPTAPRPAV
jgi:3-deoxy-D-manno-octulosonic-acid transferase